MLGFELTDEQVGARLAGGLGISKATLNRF